METMTARAPHRHVSVNELRWGTGGGETYGAGERARLIRLSPSDASALRYVLGGLSCADSAGWTNAPAWEPPSSCGAMIERLQAQAVVDERDLTDREKRKRRRRGRRLAKRMGAALASGNRELLDILLGESAKLEYAVQAVEVRVAKGADMTAASIYIHSGAPGGPPGESMQERFGDMPNDRLRDVYRAWASIRELARREPEHAVVMLRLYGPEPPGLIERTSPHPRWPRDVDGDYRRVVALVPDGELSALERLLRTDDRRREGEPDKSRTLRIAAQREAQKATLHRLGKECESIIQAAVESYRDLAQELVK